MADGFSAPTDTDASAEKPKREKRSKRSRKVSVQFTSGLASPETVQADPGPNDGTFIYDDASVSSETKVKGVNTLEEKYGADYAAKKAEVALLAIYWFLYNDEDHSSILNQSWSTVWRIFTRISNKTGLWLNKIEMRKRLLEAGYTAKPIGVVGHAGLTPRGIELLQSERLLTKDNEPTSSGQTVLKNIRIESIEVARDLLRENARNIPGQSDTTRDTDGEPDPRGSTERDLDRGPIVLADGEFDSTGNVKPIFSIHATAEEIGRRVRIKRNEKGWTQLQLAEAMGLNTKRTIQDLENGKASPSLEKVAAVMQALEITEL